MAVSVWGKLFQTKVFKGIRFPVDMKTSEDFWCMIDVLSKVQTVHISSAGLYIYYQREESASYEWTPEIWRQSLRTELKLCRKLIDVMNDGKHNDKAFFDVCRRLLYVRVVSKNRMKGPEETEALTRHVPSMSHLWAKCLPVRQRAWLLCIKLFGLKTFMETYARFVLWRTGRHHSRTAHT